MGKLGEITTKEDLVAHLISLRAAAIYGIFGQTCLQNFAKQCMAGEADPESLTTELPEGRLSFGSFMRQLATLGPQAAAETKRNANRALTRNLLKEMFRITQSFCYASGKQHTLTSQSWYEFTRILVNSLSHNFRWEVSVCCSCCGCSINAALMRRRLIDHR